MIEKIGVNVESALFRPTKQRGTAPHHFVSNGVDGQFSSMRIAGGSINSLLLGLGELDPRGLLEKDTRMKMSLCTEPFDQTFVDLRAADLA